MATEKGHVVQFNNAEGVGRVRAENGDELYVHFSQISMDGFRSLQAGQLVEFERIRQPGPNGPRDEALFLGRAVHIRLANTRAVSTSSRNPNG
jgi:CspA family cold shock protein